MRRASRGLIAIGSLLACLGAGVVATAQDKPADNMEVLREKMRADKKAVVASVLELTEGEAKVFWPVYNAYQSDMITHYDRLLKLMDDYAPSYQTMTDAAANKLVDESVAIESDRTKLAQSYLPEFKKVLPATKVVRYYQIENKVRAVINYELADRIPLVK